MKNILLLAISVDSGGDRRLQPLSLRLLDLLNQRQLHQL
jgi:hypothetical protein